MEQTILPTKSKKPTGRRGLSTLRVACIESNLEDQFKALNILGASLAIVEVTQIVHVKCFGVSS